MTWFKLDDKSAFHRKVVAAGNEAWGALCRAGAWSSGELTDGFIPDQVAALIARPRVWKLLESCGDSGSKGLVERVENGWQIHDFLCWNPSAESVKRQRETTAKRVERFRSNAVTQPVTNASSNTSRPTGCNAAPVPTRPDPDPIQTQIPPTPLAGGALPVGSDSEAGKAAEPRTPKPRRAATVKAVLPPSWAPSPAHYDQARTEGAKGREWVDAESRAMRDWAASKGERSADWDARFRNWIRKGLESGNVRPLSRQQLTIQPVARDENGESYGERAMRIAREKQAAAEAARGAV